MREHAEMKQPAVVLPPTSPPPPTHAFEAVKGAYILYIMQCGMAWHVYIS
jgi:hypothetical protein